MRIIFARHGESQANLLHEISNRGLKHPLTRRGREQAVGLAQKLARDWRASDSGQPGAQDEPRLVEPAHITRIYCSPLLRAVETAVLVAERLGVEYETVDALREYDCGVMEGRSDDAAWQGWRELLEAWMVRRDYDFRIEGGESYNDIRARFLPFIDGLAQAYAGTDAAVLCIAHGGLYLTMLPLLLRNLDWQMLQQRGFRNTGYLVAERRADGWYALEWDGEPLLE